MAGRKYWDPRQRHPYAKISDLEKYASRIIGDGKTPNLFFVTVQGIIVVISQDFTVAYAAWNTFSQSPYEHLTALEDRLHGVLAMITDDPDYPERGLERIDHTAMFGFR